MKGALVSENVRGFLLPSQTKPSVTAHAVWRLSDVLLELGTHLSGSLLSSFPARDERDWDLRGGADAGAADSGGNSPPGKHQLQGSWQLRGRGE